MKSIARMALMVACAVCLGANQTHAEEYVGSEQCQSCHESEFDHWKNSHHYQAMLPASSENVVGDFSDTEFNYAGLTSRFYKRDGRFFVTTDNEQGELQEFEIAYTFGFEPIQQYLVAFPGGKYQALNIVWDSRPKATGGQKWIHLYPDDPVHHDDIVHWTGVFQNWNSRCATCHSTGLVKNYSPSKKSYDTQWSEINVACEACHGPADQHLAWVSAEDGNRDDKPYAGFEFSLADQGVFGPGDSTVPHTLVRQDPARPSTQVETCAACHARRGEYAPHAPGAPFDQAYRLALLSPTLYFADGQVLEEVYVYGSFVQSKMHQAGVVCTNCHEPHSNRLKLEGNAVCTQCHQSDVYDQPQHHHHPVGSEGTACVSCHMPERLYMVVDARRDHSFTIPDPKKSERLGVPNACTGCHQEQDNSWAAEHVGEWYPKARNRAPHAEVLSAAWNGQSSALPGLLKLASDADYPAIIRASAIDASAAFPSQEVFQVLPEWLASNIPLIRSAAAHSMHWLPSAQRYALLRDLVEDESKSVRMAVASQLVEIPVDSLPPVASDPLDRLMAEYLAALKLNADMPEEQINLALYYQGRKDAASAEKSYRTAIRQSPQYIPAMLNLADLYRENDMDQQAQPLLEQAISIAPDQAPAWHAMGLLKVRQGKLDEAIEPLSRAVKLNPENERYTYVYAVALWESGDRVKAVKTLEQALQSHPGNRQLIEALASYYQQNGQQDELQQLLQSQQH